MVVILLHPVLHTLLALVIIAGVIARVWWMYRNQVYLESNTFVIDSKVNLRAGSVISIPTKRIRQKGRTKRIGTLHMGRVYPYLPLFIVAVTWFVLAVTRLF